MPRESVKATPVAVDTSDVARPRRFLALVLAGSSLAAIAGLPGIAGADPPVPGSLSGTVTGPDTLPRENVTVTIRTGTSIVASPTTASDGTWSASGIDPGDYTLCFAPAAPGDVAPVCNGGFLTPGDSAPVAVVEATDTPTATELPAAAALTGLVVDHEADPVDGLTLSVKRSSDPTAVAVATTAADGTFTADRELPAGSYTISYAGTIGGEPVSGSFSPDQMLVAGANDAGTLALPAPPPPPPTTGTVAGTVTGPGATPLEGIEVRVVEVDGSDTTTVASGLTLADGTYTLDDLAPGTYKVCARATSRGVAGSLCHVDALAPSTGDDVVVAAGETDTVDFSLTDGADLSGVVRDEAGNPLAGMELAVERVSDQAPTLLTGTSSLGLFSLTEDLPVGTYTISYSGAAYGTTVSGTFSPDVTLVAGANDVGTLVIPDPDPDPDPDPTTGTVSGIIQDSEGPVEAATVRIHPVGDESPEESISSAVDGSYSFEVAPGDHVLCVDPPTASSLLAECHESSLPEGATPITVVLDETTTIDVTLTEGGQVSGTVTPAGDDPTQAEVYAYAPGRTLPSAGPVTPDTDGAYTIGGLLAGEWYVCARAADHQSVCHGGADVTISADTGEVNGVQNADSVAVADDTPAVVDLDLRWAGAIAGTVEGPSGSPLAEVEVRMRPPGSFSGEITASVETDADGTYRFDEVPAGDWVVCFRPDTTIAAEECYDDTIRSLATPVTVTDDAVTLDAQLAATTTLNVTLRGTGLTGGVAGRVLVYDPDTSQDAARSRVTNPDGTVTIRGLTPGQWAVCGHVSSGYTPACNGGVTFSLLSFAPPYPVEGTEDATLITLPAGGTVNLVLSLAPAVPATAPTVSPVTAAGTRLSFSWSAVARAARYQVRIVSVRNVPTTARTFAETLPPGSRRSYQVRACNVTGCGPWSAVRGPVSTVPTAPSPLRAVNSARSVSLTWPAAREADRYEIARNGRVLSANWTRTSYTDTAPPRGRVLYGVRACNEAGCTGWVAVAVSR